MRTPFGRGIGSAVALFGILTASGHGHACVILQFPVPADLAQSQVVVRAIVRSYEPIVFHEPRLGYEASHLEAGETNAAQFEFEVVETLEGFPQPSSWKAVWPMHRQKGRLDWRGPRNVVVGLRAAVSHDGKSLIIVDQHTSCGQPVLLEDKPETVRRVREAIIAVRLSGIASPGLPVLGSSPDSDTVPELKQ